MYTNNKNKIMYIPTKSILIFCCSSSKSQSHKRPHGGPAMTGEAEVMPQETTTTSGTRQKW